MGRRLDGFDIQIYFDAYGIPTGTVDYWDQEGCGHSTGFRANTPISEIVAYHLEHYRKSHGMTPPKKCSFLIEINGKKYACIDDEPEHSGEHTIKLKDVL